MEQKETHLPKTFIGRFLFVVSFIFTITAIIIAAISQLWILYWVVLGRNIFSDVFNLSDLLTETHNTQKQ